MKQFYLQRTEQQLEAHARLFRNLLEEKFIAEDAGNSTRFSSFDQKSPPKRAIFKN